MRVVVVTTLVDEATVRSLPSKEILISWMGCCLFGIVLDDGFLSIGEMTKSEQDGK